MNYHDYDEPQDYSAVWVYAVLLPFLLGVLLVFVSYEHEQKFPTETTFTWSTAPIGESWTSTYDDGYPSTTKKPPKPTLPIKWVSKHDCLDDIAFLDPDSALIPVLTVADLERWLLPTLDHCLEYWNGLPNERAMHDALEHTLNELADLRTALRQGKEG